MKENHKNSRTAPAAGLGLAVLLGLLSQCPERDGIAAPASRAPQSHLPNHDLEKIRHQIKTIFESPEGDTAEEANETEAQVKITEPIKSDFDAFKPLYDCMRSNPDLVCVSRSNLFTSVMSCYPQSNPEAVPVEFTDFSMFRDDEVPSYAELFEIWAISSRELLKKFDEWDTTKEPDFRLSVAPASNIFAFDAMPEQWVEHYFYDSNPKKASEVLTKACNQALHSFIDQPPSVEAICEGSSDCEDALDRNIEERDELEKELEKINGLANRLNFEGIEWQEGFDSFSLDINGGTVGYHDREESYYVSNYIDDGVRKLPSIDDVVDVLTELEDSEE